MVFIVTFTLHSAPTVADHVLSRRSSRSSSAPKLEIDEKLVNAIFGRLSIPFPDHVTFHPTQHSFLLPARFLLHFFDEKQGRKAAKTKSLDAEMVNVDGYDRVITGTLAASKESELRSFVQAAGFYKSAKILKTDLSGALISSDCIKAKAEEAKRVTELEKKIFTVEEEIKELQRVRDEECEELKSRVSLQTRQLKALRSKLAETEHRDEQKALKSNARGYKNSVVIRAAVLVKQPYNTRRSLTVAQGSDA